jgi:hypothetical protein
VNTVEELLRDAFSAKAETVSRDSLRGLPDWSQHTQRLRRRAPWRRRLTPLAVAAAVIAIVGAAVITPVILAGHKGTAASPGRSSGSRTSPASTSSPRLRSSPTPTQSTSPTASPGAGAAGTFPAVFAASLQGSATASSGEGIAVLSSQTGDLLRWLTPLQNGVTDSVLSMHDGWVYFRRNAGSGPAAIWRVPVAGGGAQLVQTGGIQYAVSPDGDAVASVITADNGTVVEIVASNLATGQQNTIVMATNPDNNANNWPPGVFSLTWAPDDTHLAVQFAPTAAINTVLVFDAFTATTISDGVTAPAPCVLTSSQCAELDPDYLASGALTYIVQQISASGIVSDSLVTSQAGGVTTLVSLPPGELLTYDMTAQGQAIWADAPAEAKGPWTIWRWSGGAPVEITALPPVGAPYYGVGAIAW